MNWTRSVGERLRPEKVFLVLALTFGLAVMIANPPFQAPDEGDHFYRAFQISEGTMVGQEGFGNAGGSLPVIAFRVADPENISFHPEVKMTAAIWRKKAEPAWIDWSKAERAFCGFPHSVVYPPTSYVPQAAAIFTGRLLQVGPLGLMYLARLAGFAASIALGYAALRRLPVFRWSALVLLLCPMSLYLFGSVESDGVLITAAFLLAAWLARIASEASDATGSKLSGLTQTTLLALAALLAIAKFVYVPLTLLVPVFLSPRLSCARARCVFAVAFLVLCLVPLWLWSRAASGVYLPGRSDIPIDPVAQGHFVAAHPLVFLSVLAKSIAGEAGGIHRWFVGTLGWGDTPLPEWYYATFGVGLMACLVVESCDARALCWKHRALLVGSAIVASVLIAAAQYAIWNSPGSLGPIESLQGRYFLPVAPFLLLGFPRLIRRRPPAALAAVMGATLAALGAVVCLWAVTARFYLT